MTEFVSYAQNFEDVMLWRALKHVENGYYVDIGAQDPVFDSVSLAFYYTAGEACTLNELHIMRTGFVRHDPMKSLSRRGN